MRIPVFNKDLDLRLRQDLALRRGGLVAGVAGPTVVALLAAATAVVLLALGVGQPVVLTFGINAIMVVGFQAFVGNTGIMSFGHVAFMALGAYAAGIVSAPPALKHALLPGMPNFFADLSVGMVPSLLIAGAAAAIVAAVSGVVLMRLTGSASAIGTFGLLIITNQVLSNSNSITNGSQTFSGVPATSTTAWVFGVLVLAVAASAVVKWSPIGLGARAVRDDPVAAQASGLRLLPPRLTMFVFSAFLTGVGGGLWAHLLTAFSPSSFFISQVVVIVAMAILGGLDGVTGAVVGAAAMSFIQEFLRNLEGGLHVGAVHLPAMLGIGDLILGVGLVALLRWRPGGIAGANELNVDIYRIADRLRRDRSSSADGQHAKVPATNRVGAK
jgi:branched-chain amino acid transport system permease protein